MNTRTKLFSLIALFAFAVAPDLYAQTDATDGTLVERIQAVSRSAKGVQSATGFTEVIKECDLLLAEDLKKPAHRNYLKTLLGWALDKRGDSRVELADQFRKAGSLEQANMVINQAFEDYNRSIENDATRWQTPMHRGTLLVEQNKFAEAIADFSKVIELHPQSSSAWFNRGELRFQLGEFNGAIKDYNQVLKIDPEDLQSISGRAHCLLAKEEFVEALRDYDEIVKRLPNDGWALANRADAHLAMNHWQKACDDLEKSTRLQRNGEFCRRLAWLLATCPEEAICDGERSLIMARKAIDITGESVANLDTLAAAHAAAGDFEKARDVHARVIAMQDTEDPATSVKQAAYENNERYQETFDR